MLVGLVVVRSEYRDKLSASLVQKAGSGEGGGWGGIRLKKYFFKIRQTLERFTEWE